MPREEIPDTDTADLYVSVRWLDRGQLPEGESGYVQLGAFSHHRDRELLDLLLEGQQITVAMMAVAMTRERPSEVLQARVRQWRRRVDEFRASLVGPYVSLRPDTIRRVVKALHRAGRGAWTLEERRELARQARPRQQER